MPPAQPRALRRRPSRRAFGPRRAPAALRAEGRRTHEPRRRARSDHAHAVLGASQLVDLHARPVRAGSSGGLRSRPTALR
eukprot:2459883-Alexandrium_andersonii.AAC.1